MQNTEVGLPYRQLDPRSSCTWPVLKMIKAAVPETSTGTKLRQQKTVTFQMTQVFMIKACRVSNPPPSQSVHKYVASCYLIINFIGDTRFGLVHKATATANGRRNSPMSSSPPPTELLSGLRTGTQNYEPDSSASIVTELRKPRPTVGSSTPDKRNGLFSSPKRPDRL